MADRGITEQIMTKGFKRDLYAKGICETDHLGFDLPLQQLFPLPAIYVLTSAVTPGFLFPSPHLLSAHTE